MDYTQMTLGMLLSAKDETIRRNAISILKRLQANREHPITRKINNKKLDWGKKK